MLNVRLCFDQIKKVGKGRMVAWTTPFTIGITTAIQLQ